jgi:hypothetical protein
LGQGSQDMTKERCLSAPQRPGDQSKRSSHISFPAKLQNTGARNQKLVFRMSQ